eukprot:scpid80796/ scgid33434/ 
MSCHILAGVKLATAQALGLLVSSGGVNGEDGHEGSGSGGVLHAPAVLGITVACIAVFAIGGFFCGCSCPKQLRKSTYKKVADDKRSLLGGGESSSLSYSSTDGLPDITRTSSPSRVLNERLKRVDSASSQVSEMEERTTVSNSTLPSVAPNQKNLLLLSDDDRSLSVLQPSTPKSAGYEAAAAQAAALSGYSNALHDLESSESHSQSPSAKRNPGTESQQPDKNATSNATRDHFHTFIDDGVAGRQTSEAQSGSSASNEQTAASFDELAEHSVTASKAASSLPVDNACTPLASQVSRELQPVAEPMCEVSPAPQLESMARSAEEVSSTVQPPVKPHSDAAPEMADDTSDAAPQMTEDKSNAVPEVAEDKSDAALTSESTAQPVNTVSGSESAEPQQVAETSAEEEASVGVVA